MPGQIALVHKIVFPAEDIRKLKDNPSGEEVTDAIINIEELKQFFQEELGDLTLYDYFESMCKLISLMCLMRNYKGI